MNEAIVCPKCRMMLAASSDVFGASVRCTRCRETFTVHAHHILNREPPNRRLLMLGGAALLGLVVITGTIMMVHALTEEKPQGGGLSGMSDAEVAAKLRETDPLPMVTKDGIPIERPNPNGPDRALQAILEKEAQAALAKPAAATKDDVVLSSIKWEVAPNVRRLQIAYSFQNGTSPGSGLYVLKLKVATNAPVSVPFETTFTAQGVLEFRPEAGLSEQVGRMPTVEAWVERTVGGTSQAVSNKVRTD